MVERTGPDTVRVWLVSQPQPGRQPCYEPGCEYEGHSGPRSRSFLLNRPHPQILQHLRRDHPHSQRDPGRHDHEFAIPGQLVADVSVISVDQATLPEPRMVVELELLLLEDG